MHMDQPPASTTQRGWLLAIDTSTERAGIALTDDERTAELSWPAGRTQTVSVLPQIEHLLDLCGVHRDALGAVAVAIGPGTFTGLRVGLALAKGLVLARDLPLIGVPTLDVAAAPYTSTDTPVVVAVAAGRGRIVWAAYGHDEGVGEGVGEGFDPDYGPVNTLGEELVDWLRDHPQALVAGELSSALRSALVAANHQRIESAALSVRRPAALAAIGWRRWQSGDIDDAASLEPVYLHAARPSSPPIRDSL